MDIRLDKTGDILLSTDGDFALTDSIRQAVIIKIRWIHDEWRLGPNYGFPWYEEVFVKNPNFDKLRSLLRSAIMEVDGVTAAEVTDLKFNNGERKLQMKFTFSVGENDYWEEVELYG